MAAVATVAVTLDARLVIAHSPREDVRVATGTQEWVCGLFYKLGQLIISVYFAASLLVEFLVFVLALVGTLAPAIFLVPVGIGSAPSSWTLLTVFLLQWACGCSSWWKQTARPDR